MTITIFYKIRFLKVEKRLIIIKEIIKLEDN